MTTNGLSFYQIQAGTAELSISYAFDALSQNDINVMVIASDDSRIYLTKDIHFTLDFPTQTITCIEPSWDSISGVAASSDIRIYRTTSVLPLINFKAGAVLSEGDLDISYKQGLFAAQEMTEDAALTGAGGQSVSTGVIVDGAVTTAKIAAGAVGAFQIANNAIDTGKLNTNAVQEPNIANNAVTNLKISNNAVTTEKIFNGQVTTAKIADDSVTQAKVDKASKTEMESQSSTDGVVTPDVLKYSPFAPRCYGSVTYDGGSPDFSPGSYNVESVSRGSNQRRTINFSTPLSDTNYFVSVTGSSTTSPTNFYGTVLNKTENGFQIDGAVETETATFSFDFVVFGSTLNES